MQSRPPFKLAFKHKHMWYCVTENYILEKTSNKCFTHKMCHYCVSFSKNCWWKLNKLFLFIYIHCLIWALTFGPDLKFNKKVVVNSCDICATVLPEGLFCLAGYYCGSHKSKREKSLWFCFPLVVWIE